MDLLYSDLDRLVKLAGTRKITGGKMDVWDYIQSHQNKVFRTGVWVKNNSTVVVTTAPRTAETKKLNQHKLNIRKSQRLMNKSDSFGWGIEYAEDTQQLSIALLLETFGYSTFGKQITEFFYQLFDEDVVSKLPGTWKLSTVDIVNWVKHQLDTKSDIDLLKYKAASFSTSSSVLNEGKSYSFGIGAGAQAV